MFKIPDDSLTQDDITPPTFFHARNAVKLDETVRNHGRAGTPPDNVLSSDNKERSGSETASTVQSTPAAVDTQTTVQSAPAAVDTQTTVQPVPDNTGSLSAAFSHLKQTEFYDETAVERAAEECKKKRRIDRPPEPGPPSIARNKGEQSGGSGVLVSTRQRGNPLLTYMRNVVVSYRDDIQPDYIVGASSAVIFLSLKYHRLHPDYIYDRLRQLGSGFAVRVLLILVDIPDSASSLQELTKVALLSNFTLFLAWSSLEAARYIEAFKIYENKPAEVLKGFKDSSYQGHLTQFLTSIRGVNKTDVNRLKSELGSVKDIIHAERSKFAAIPGIGDKKADRISEIFNQPFKSLDKT